WRQLLVTPLKAEGLAVLHRRKNGVVECRYPLVGTLFRERGRRALGDNCERKNQHSGDAAKQLHFASHAPRLGSRPESPPTKLDQIQSSRETPVKAFQVQTGANLAIVRAWSR